LQVEDHTLHVFLADFGLGHAITNTQGVGTATMMAGTPGFQAPEQLKGEGIGVKCDVYALGGVMTELFGRQPLWVNTSIHTIIYKVTVEGVFPPTDHLPQPIGCIVRNCLCSASDRKSTADILCQLINLKVQ